MGHAVEPVGLLRRPVGPGFSDEEQQYTGSPHLRVGSQNESGWTTVERAYSGAVM